MPGKAADPPALMTLIVLSGLSALDESDRAMIMGGTAKLLYPALA